MKKHLTNTEIKGVYGGLLGDDDRVDYLYRISLKAVIFNDEGKLLVTNEAGRGWHLPGGGIEHGETIEQGLKRELNEEIGYDGGLQYEVIGAEPMWMGDELNMWQMWIVCRVTIERLDITTDQAKFINLDELANLEGRDSELSYKYAMQIV